MINSLLTQAQKTKHFISFSPMGTDSIEQTNQELINSGNPPLPSDFCDFLSLCDGIYYDGLELFGTKEHPRPTKEYVFTNIIKANTPFSEYSFFSQKLIIGDMSENFIIYDSKNKLFAVIDRTNLCSQVEFSSFEELLSYLLRHCEIEL